LSGHGAGLGLRDTWWWQPEVGGVTSRDGYGPGIPRPTLGKNLPPDGDGDRNQSPSGDGDGDGCQFSPRPRPRFSRFVKYPFPSPLFNPRLGKNSYSHFFLLDFNCIILYVVKVMLHKLVKL